MADVNYQKYPLTGECLILHQIRCYCRDNKIKNIKQFINNNNAPFNLREYAWNNPIKEYEQNNTLDKNNEHFHKKREQQVGKYPIKEYKLFDMFYCIIMWILLLLIINYIIDIIF